MKEVKGIGIDGVPAADGSVAMWSDSCDWRDLCLPSRQGWMSPQLALTEGWTRRWSATFAYGRERNRVTCPVRDLAGMPWDGAVPVRRFSWRTGQRHRPSLEFMASTGQLHGAESREEARLLLVLDFAAGVRQLLTQPFRLRFGTGDGFGEHIPDVLVLTGSGVWLIDVRPAGRIKEEDVVRFAAAAEAAASCGWRYAVVSGWREHVQTTLDTLSARRRPMQDVLGLDGQLLAAMAGGPLPFGELVAATAVTAVARAQAIGMIWRRRLGIDLAVPFGDGSLVRLRPEPGGPA